MQLLNLKAVIAVIYVATVGAAGLAGGVASAPGWAAVAGLALLPPIAMLTLWIDPSPTLSEAIHEARR